MMSPLAYSCSESVECVFTPLLASPAQSHDSIALTSIIGANPIIELGETVN